MVAFYALVIGLAGLIFFYIGVSMGWLYVRQLEKLMKAQRALIYSYIDLHGRDPWLSRRPDRTLHNMEQGQQMGMHYRRDLRLLGWHYRLARYH